VREREALERDSTREGQLGTNLRSRWHAQPVPFKRICLCIYYIYIIYSIIILVS
jgi:hypothetical protein